MQRHTTESCMLNETDELIVDGCLGKTRINLMVRGRATKKDGRLIRELRVAANTGGGGGAEMTRKQTVHGDTRPDNRCAPVPSLETQ
ncbi:hypothetical protein NDU88_000950 [Pleurodeles waltl]|uniref:Uncharacterized protein n=1 Tax=Pleurodeles waltl TaxID=8319 RepID=A0AAV7LZK9_PLEWA|nr:hypothetical protein NDU88_000950 [Pleurodeles waltl]